MLKKALEHRPGLPVSTAALNIGYYILLGRLNGAYQNVRTLFVLQMTVSVTV
jgi:hypothetical protein